MGLYLGLDLIPKIFQSQIASYLAPLCQEETWDAQRSLEAIYPDQEYTNIENMKISPLVPPRKFRITVLHNVVFYNSITFLQLKGRLQNASRGKIPLGPGSPLTIFCKQLSGNFLMEKGYHRTGRIFHREWQLCPKITVFAPKKLTLIAKAHKCDSQDLIYCLSCVL